MSRNVIVFYDSPCIDGSAAAWAVDQALKNDPSCAVEYVPLGYGKPQERTQKILSHLHTGAEVIFVDTSPKEDTLELLFNPPQNAPKIKKLTVLDHHASEVARLRRFEQGQKNFPSPDAPELEFILDPDKPAAALLAWEHFNPKKSAPKLLEWVGKMEPPVRLQTRREYAMAAFIDSQSIRPDDMMGTIDKLINMSEEDMVSQGTSILADQFNNIEKGIKTSILFAKMELLPGRSEWIPLVNANVQNFGRGVNQVLIEAAFAGTTCGVAGAWFVQGDGTVKLSLRSKGNPDLGKITDHLKKSIGVSGGGHATDAAVQFNDLAHFVSAVKLCTKEQMLEQRWNGNGHGHAEVLGAHTAAAASRRNAGGHGKAH